MRAIIPAVTAVPDGVCSVPVLGQVCNLPAHVVQQGWAAVVDSFSRSVGTVLTLLFTFWEKIPAPSLSVAPGSPVGDLQGVLWWVVGPVAVLSILVGMGRMAWSQRAQPGVDTLRSVAVLAVVMGSGVALVAGLVTAADGLAQGILDQSTGGQFQDRLVAIGQVNMAVNPALGGSSSALVLLVALVALVGSLVQCAVLVLRGALLVVMVATLPLAASATNTEIGRAWFRKSTAWLLAFIALKPAAALVYATGFYLIADGVDAVSIVGGMMVLALAAFTLPALMKLLVPAVASVSGGIGAGEAIAGVGALATGAVGIAGMSRGPAAGSGSRSSGSGSGSSAGLASRQTTSTLAAESLSSSGFPGSSGSSGAAGSPGGSSTRTGGAGASGSAGAGGSAGLRGSAGAGGSTGSGGAPGADGATGAADAADGSAAPPVAGPAGIAATAAVRAAGQVAQGAKTLGAAGTGDEGTS